MHRSNGNCYLDSKSHRHRDDTSKKSTIQDRINHRVNFPPLRWKSFVKRDKTYITKIPSLFSFFDAIMYTDRPCCRWLTIESKTGGKIRLGKIRPAKEALPCFIFVVLITRQVQRN